MNFHGKGGLAKDHKKALEWFRKAATQNDAEALYMVGHMHYFGEGGLTEDRKTGLEWWRKAAEGDPRDGHHHHDAQLQVAFCQERGLGGLVADLAEAARLRRPVREAAAGGDAEARKDLAAHELPLEATAAELAAIERQRREDGRCAQCGTRLDDDEGRAKECLFCHAVRYCGNRCRVDHWRGEHRPACTGKPSAVGKAAAAKKKAALGGKPLD